MRFAFGLPPERLALFLTTDLGTFAFCPAPADCAFLPTAFVALVPDFRALTSFNAAAFCLLRRTLFWPAFLRISSKLKPTTARPTFVTRRVRFLVLVSARPFLLRRRQACVHTNLAGFLRCRVREYALDDPRKIGFPSRRMKRDPFPG